MTKFFNKSQNPCFWAIFLIFGAKTFLENQAVVHNFIWVSSTMLCNDTIPRKRPDWRKGRRKDGRTDITYFKGAFQLPPGVQKNYYMFAFFVWSPLINLCSSEYSITCHFSAEEWQKNGQRHVQDKYLLHEIHTFCMRYIPSAWDTYLLHEIHTFCSACDATRWKRGLI